MNMQGRTRRAGRANGRLVRHFTELDVEPLRPPHVGEPGGGQQVASVGRGQSEHLTQAGDVSIRRQDNSCLLAFAREDLFVVSGSPRQVRKQPENAHGGAWLREVAPDLRSSRGVVPAVTQACGTSLPRSHSITPADSLSRPSRRP